MRIVCMGDTHYSSMRWKGDYLRRINHKFYTRLFRTFFAQEADLYLSLGDITHFGALAEYRGVYSIIEEAKKDNQRFLQVVGNHDLYKFSKKSYQRLTNMDLYWSEDHPEAKLIFLDTSRARHPGKKSGRMSMEQVLWLEKEFEEAEDKLCIVFAHHPISRIEILDDRGQVIEGFSLMDVLETKDNGGIYVNGHLHKDRFSVKNNWAFLQFNDILDEPTIRIIEIDGNNVTLETVSCINEEYLEYSQEVAKAILTFRRTRNDEEFATIKGLNLDLSNEKVRIDQTIRTQTPYYSKEARIKLRMKLAHALYGVR